MIYLDYAATTPMFIDCAKAFTNFSTIHFFNPSALYKPALDVRLEINSARQGIAECLGVNSSEIIFTASGSEADNLAIFGSTIRKSGKILIASAEHSAVHNCALELINRGFNVEFIKIDEFGRVDIVDLAAKLSEKVCFVSIMHASNETGAVNDLKKISTIIKEVAPNAIFHSDGVQAFGKIATNVAELGVDLYSISAHKINGPKGIGALYVRHSINLKPIILGGGQEKGLRSATENVAAIIAFAKAAEMHNKSLKQDYEIKSAIIVYTVAKLLQKFDTIKINTPSSGHNASIISLAFFDVRGEVILHSLEKHGIIIGTGSACSSAKDNKRIPTALGIGDAYAKGMIRISISETTTIGEIDQMILKLEEEYKNLKMFKRV